jgi:hypothetical protein
LDLFQGQNLGLTVAVNLHFTKQFFCRLRTSKYHEIVNNWKTVTLSGQFLAVCCE